MTVINDTLILFILALIPLSSISFREAWTPPAGGSLSPAVVGRRTKRQQIIEFTYPSFPLLQISLDIASLNEFLFKLYLQPPTSNPGKVYRVISTILPQLDALYSTYRPPDLSPVSPLLFLSLAVAGKLIRNYCYRAFRGTFRFDVAAGGKHRPLITSGPYSIVRHPAYTGMWLIYFGIVGFHLTSGSWIHASLTRSSGPNPYVATAVGMWTVLAFVVQALLILRMKDEDELLHGYFKDEWERWSKDVKYRLIPGVY